MPLNCAPLSQLKQTISQLRSDRRSTSLPVHPCDSQYSSPGLTLARIAHWPTNLLHNLLQGWNSKMEFRSRFNYLQAHHAHPSRSAVSPRASAVLRQFPNVPVLQENWGNIRLLWARERGCANRDSPFLLFAHGFSSAPSSNRLSFTSGGSRNLGEGSPHPERPP
jgi:hypothetical protein